jgi:threonylcarbamoyladenosine tRNA methylthiotransferase MtaB
MQARQAVRRAVRENPGARIVVTGCYAQTEPEALAQIEGVEAVIGQADKFRIPELIENIAQEPQSKLMSRHADIHRETTFKDLSVSAFDSRTRPFLKVQDGCNAFCTYCIVPHSRGRSRSMPVDGVLKSLLRYNAAGYHEVVLTGIHLGCYGQDLSPATGLLQLLERIDASGFKGRIRLSSIEPLELTDDIIRLVGACPKFCRHFHVPLQSGDNHILERMHRPYTSEFFRERVEKIIEEIPDAAIGVDTLIGFPGEDRDAFDNTYNLIRELPVAYLHVFPFSPRKRTPAYLYPDQIPAEISKRRCEKMRLLGAGKREAFYRGNRGKKVEVLVESQRDADTGLLKGLTSNYIPVLLDGSDSLQEHLVNATIDRIDDKLHVFGVL